MRGAAGERAAERELKRRRMVLLERNVRAGGGEIDLVALDRDTLVFVEVKSRSSAAFGEPAEAVDAAKRGRIVRAARAFLARKRMLDRPRRYDVAAVLLDENGRPATIDWISGAFDEEGCP